MSKSHHTFIKRLSLIKPQQEVLSRLQVACQRILRVSFSVSDQRTLLVRTVSYWTLGCFRKMAAISVYCDVLFPGNLIKIVLTIVEQFKSEIDTHVFN